MASFKSRPSKISSILGVIVGVGILIAFLSEFGGSRSIPSVPGQPGSGFGGSFGVFGIVFLVALLSIIGYHLYNASTGKGYDEVIDLEDSDRDLPSVSSPSERDSDEEEKSSASERLWELKQLRSEGLISEEEFEAKRKEIINSL